MSGYKFNIVYPETRSVGEDTIRGWYADAVDNGEIEEADHEVDLFEAARLLDDAGIITVSGEPEWVD